MSERRHVKEILIELVMRVARNYYSGFSIMVLDLLALKGAISGEDMATSLRINPQNTRKACKKLLDDRLIKENSTVTETRAYGHVKRQTRTYYYIDYKSFLNVLRYKMFKIQEMIRKEIDEHNNNLSYECANCKTKFDPYAVLRNIRPSDGLFVCEYCPDSVLEQEKGIDFENDLSRRFNEERGPILQLLQACDQEVIPEFTAPSAESIAATTAGATAQMLQLTGDVKVELDGIAVDNDDTVEVGDGNGTGEGYDEDGFLMDNKDLMNDYYANLQKQLASESAAPAPPATWTSFSFGPAATPAVVGGYDMNGGSSSMYGMNGGGLVLPPGASDGGYSSMGTMSTSGIASLNASTKRVADDDADSRKKQKEDEKDSDDDEEFVEL